MKTSKILIAIAMATSLTACGVIGGSKPAVVVVKTPVAPTTAEIMARLDGVTISNNVITATFSAHGTSTGIFTASKTKYSSTWRIVDGKYCRTFIKGYVAPEKCADVVAVYDADGKIIGIKLIDEKATTEYVTDMPA
ncbi:MAG: hypothetical protein HRU29_15110 [Rhizobiales bacterium]|nr:hypothetical protein [Hyphomicrobiales bacterium]NRB15725.1 hypothetical protein [Hyphomicrobiales bacterium]